MKLKELITQLQNKLDKHGDTEVFISANAGRGDYIDKQIIDITHKGEDGLKIEINY